MEISSKITAMDLRCLSFLNQSNCTNFIWKWFIIAKVASEGWKSQLIQIYTVYNRGEKWFILFSKVFIYCFSTVRYKLSSLHIICCFGQVEFFWTRTLWSFTCPWASIKFYKFLTPGNIAVIMFYLWIKFVKGSISFFPSRGSRGVKAPNWKCKNIMNLHDAVNVLKFWTLFPFCSQIKCLLSGLELTKCLSEYKQGRPWSVCFFRSSLIWVWRVCLDLFGWQLVFQILEHLLYAYMLE